MIKIPNKEINYIENSWMDEKARVFRWNGRFFRGIYPSASKEIIELFDSGLLNELINKKLIPNSWITNYCTDQFSLIIEHKIIDPISYPYEWSFSMLKDAALTVLKVNQIAKKFEYQTKDCHAWNIAFDKLNPVFVDIGSFIKLNKKSTHWIAYEEFIRNYYFPLKIWSDGDSFSAKRFLFTEYGFIPSHSIYSFKKGFFKFFIKRNVYSKYLNLILRLKTTDLNHINLNNVDSIIKRVVIKIIKMTPLTNSSLINLENKVLKIKKPKINTFWADYHSENYKSRKVKPRFERILELINSFNDITSVVDVAGNQGFFSKLVLKKTNVQKIFTLDYDEEAVDIMYLNSKTNIINPDAIVLQNLILPIVNRDSISPNLRLNADAVCALALVHHLVLSQNFPIEKVFETICSYSNKYVFVEFMPLGLWDGIKSPKLPDWYNEYWFKNNFESFCDIIHQEKIEENRIIFIGIKK